MNQMIEDKPLTATELIERIELETKSRIDDPNGSARDMLFGALARMMDPRSHDSRDDSAAGVMLRENAQPK